MSELEQWILDFIKNYDQWNADIQIRYMITVLFVEVFGIACGYLTGRRKEKLY